MIAMMSVTFGAESTLPCFGFLVPQEGSPLDQQDLKLR